MSAAEQLGRGRSREDRGGEARRPILVARPTGRGESLSGLLAADGFVAEHRPFIELVLVGQERPSGTDHPAGADHADHAEPPCDLTALLSDLSDLAAGAFTHLVVTSRTTVDALLAATPTTPARLPATAPASVPAPAPAPAPALIVPSATRVIAVGEGTASALAEAGVPAHTVAGGSGAALVEEMDPPGAQSLVWFPASAAASPTVREGLEAKGYRVRQTIAYRPRTLAQPAEVNGGLPTGRYGALVLTSPMIARVAAQIGVHPSTPVVSIGDPTSEGARAAGLTVTAQAESTDDEALARAVRQVVRGAARSSSE